MWVDNYGNVVHKGQGYVPPDGSTTYTAQCDMDTVPGLTRVVMTDAPNTEPTCWTDMGQARGGVTFGDPAWSVKKVNGVWTQVWNTISRPALSDAERAVVEGKKLKTAAQAALDSSDLTVLRCYEYGVAVPADWVTYRQDLRDIKYGRPNAKTSLPATPAYPAGTGT